MYRIESGVGIEETLSSVNSFDTVHANSEKTINQRQTLIIA